MSAKMISCKSCGKEIAASAKACPECGAKNKKPIYKKWWIWAIIAVVAIAIIAGGGSGKGEKIIWNDILLGTMLPEPPANKGKIHENSTDGLWIKIHEISDKEFAEYVENCKGKGFTIEAESDSSSYDAYNAEGYKLSLSHYGGSEADLGIQLEVPMELSAIVWPSSEAGKQLPAPKSTIGQFSYEYDDNFFVYVGDTSREDYTEYVNACSEHGFNVDYSKGDGYYYADNSEGWHISLCYEGNSVMSININAPDEKSSTNETDASETTTEEPKSDTIGLDPEFKAAMDSYEGFMDEYVAFMEKYKNNPSDLGLLADYTNYMSKYSDFVNDFEKWEDAEMNAAETAYYLEVQTRVSQKLIAVAY